MKELERGARTQANLSEMKRREKNWSTNTNNNDDCNKCWRYQSQGIGKIGELSPVDSAKHDSQDALNSKKLQDEEALSSRLMQSNREKDAKIANLTNRIRNMERYNTRNNM